VSTPRVKWGYTLALTVQNSMPRDKGCEQARCANLTGINLHAAVRCGAEHRQALEKLSRYITRPAMVARGDSGLT
jgi:hypothetical protein